MKSLERYCGLLLLSFILILVSCSEDLKTAPMRVKLITYADNNQQLMLAKDLSLLTAVNLDIRECDIHYSKPYQVEGWFALPSHVGIYNVLKLTNDATLILVQDTKLPQGTITQLRWILGPNNSIEMGGVTY